MDDDDIEQAKDEPPCLFCWALGQLGLPCPGHRLAERRTVLERVR